MKQKLLLNTIERNKYYDLSTQELADDFLNNIVFDFYDAVMTECHYESGSSRDHDKNSLYCFDSTARMIMVFETQCMNGFTFELCFDHIVRFNLLPSPPEDYDSLWGKSDIYLKGGFVFLTEFCTDRDFDKEPNDMTWVKAKSLKFLIKS